MENFSLKTDGSRTLKAFFENGYYYCEDAGFIVPTDALIDVNNYHYDGNFGWIDEAGNPPADVDAHEYRLTMARQALLEAVHVKKEDSNPYRMRAARREYEEALKACRDVWDEDSVQECLERVDYEFDRRRVDADVERARLQENAARGAAFGQDAGRVHDAVSQLREELKGLTRQVSDLESDFAGVGKSLAFAKQIAEGLSGVDERAATERN